MKILLATHHLDNLAGSELYTADLARELASLGHQVAVFTFQTGELSQDLEKEGIFTTDDPEKISSRNFDIAHVNHNITAIVIRSLFPDLPIVQMVHGVIPFLERLPSIDVGISAYLGNSEEVKGHLVEKYQLNSQDIIISRNFVNIHRFFPQNEISEKPEKLLVLSNHYQENIKNIIEPACSELGIEVIHAGYPENPVRDVENWINRADIVVTIGRGAIEAMACGRNVIIFDIHGMDGLVTDENFYDFRKFNFSGRFLGKMPTREVFKKEILRYQREYGKNLCQLIGQEQSAKVIVGQLVETYEDFMRRKIPSKKISKGEIMPELVYLEKEIGDWKKKSHLFLRELSDKRDELENIKRTYNILKNRIDVMSSSKFWKMRNKYLKFKKIIIGK